MGLNENEQRMVEEFERQLYREDPRFAASFGGSRFDRPRGRFAPLMAVLLAVGLLAIGYGVSAPAAWAGVAGFVIALFALYGLLEAALGNKGGVGSGEAGADRSAKPRKDGKSGKWHDRAGERFDRRRDENQ